MYDHKIGNPHLGGVRFVILRLLRGMILGKYL
jgi:hypothetical protein